VGAWAPAWALTRPHQEKGCPLKNTVDTETISTTLGVKALEVKESLAEKAAARKQAKAEKLVEKAKRLSLTPEQRQEQARQEEIARLQKQLADLQG